VKTRTAILAVMLLTIGPALGAGIEATLTDTFDIAMRLTDLQFKIKPVSVTEGRPVSLDHFQVVSGGKTVNVWLMQIATATFAGAGGGQTTVKAVLQGKQGDTVEGAVENTRRCYFQGKIAEGARKGRAVKFPLAEVRSIKNHTKYAGTGKPGSITPMPAPGQDAFWVSSVPLGAQVWAKAFDCPEARVWGTYKLIGKTPLLRDLRPGKYAVKVVVPDKLAGELRPATKLGEDANPFEFDGWGEVDFRQGQNVLESVTYTVNKKADKPATLIALFQKQGLSFEDVLKIFPEGHNFYFSDKKLEGRLLYNQVPKLDIPGILDALHRGGKVIWHGKARSFMITLLPGGKWDLTYAKRPGKKK
jgi:hypothetical protein